MQYLLETERLGFRTWKEEDREWFRAMNADPEVMRFFPGTLSNRESDEFLGKLVAHFDVRGYCYFAVELRETTEAVGFIGMAYQEFDVDFTPAVDVGWRLRKEHWGRGYATEGATGVLEYAAKKCWFDKLIATAPCINEPSISVMKKIGMDFVRTFEHPRLNDSPHIQQCALYEKHLA